MPEPTIQDFRQDQAIIRVTTTARAAAQWSQYGAISSRAVGGREGAGGGRGLGGLSRANCLQY